MGALTDSVVFRDIEVRSGDVVAFTPRGWLSWLRRPFLAIVDARDRSIPYLVVRKRTRVWKVPLQGAPYRARAWDIEVWRHPDLDKAKGGVVAGKAAERPGEGVHHPSYDCGRECASDVELVREAFRAAGIDVGDGERLRLDGVFGRVTGGRGDGGISYRAGKGAERLMDRGIGKTLPWQKRTRR